MSSSSSITSRHKAVGGEGGLPDHKQGDESEIINYNNRPVTIGLKDDDNNSYQHQHHTTIEHGSFGHQQQQLQRQQQPDVPRSGHTRILSDSTSDSQLRRPVVVSESAQQQQHPQQYHYHAGFLQVSTNEHATTRSQSTTTTTHLVDRSSRMKKSTVMTTPTNELKQVQQVPSSVAVSQNNNNANDGFDSTKYANDGWSLGSVAAVAAEAAFAQHNHGVGDKLEYVDPLQSFPPPDYYSNRNNHPRYFHTSAVNAAAAAAAAAVLEHSTASSKLNAGGRKDTGFCGDDLVQRVGGGHDADPPDNGSGINGRITATLFPSPHQQQPPSLPFQSPPGTRQPPTPRKAAIHGVPFPPIPPIHHDMYGSMTPDNNDDDGKSKSSGNLHSQSSDCSGSSSNDERKYERGDSYVEAYTHRTSLCHACMVLCDPIGWLSTGVQFDNQGRASFHESAACTLPGFVRHFLYNPYAPEFTSLQQFNWAVILGIVMGFYTAVWKGIMEAGVAFVWRTIPEYLLGIGVFTDLDGAFPLYHYMWICPAVMSGVLSYAFVVLPMKIPDQNDWINSVHSRGVIDHRTFLSLFILSTVGMTSGLSLGPELPLVLTAGMVGSWLGLVTQQSMLQARVLNLTAASAAVGGFFGFPMAGAIYVLELPHRMGLQYFEALSPATLSSIVAVLANRLITGNEVTGYYSYPFLTLTLPSQIFSSAVVYGLFGAAIGIAYAHCVLKLKQCVHDWFHAPAPNQGDGHNDPIDRDEAVIAGRQSQPQSPLDDKHSSNEDAIERTNFETIPLMESQQAIKQQQHGSQRPPRPTTCVERFHKLVCCVIPQEKYRAAVAGSISGALCGIVGIFVPHTMFWGEAQLQNLIDKGRTPLPVFGQEGEVTSDLVALGYCMIDPHDAAAVRAGFSITCSALISVSKIIVIGLSLGTGIIGGHFWGPLVVGCAAGHLFCDLVHKFSHTFGFGNSLAAHPCVVILCTMASAHVVTFRAHLAIMLILTLTISAFSPEDDTKGHNDVAGDYSAVFPLLVVSVFVALMVSPHTVFYKTQRSRGDIMAVPEVLCEPGTQGAPLVVDFDAESDGGSFFEANEADRGAFGNNDDVDRCTHHHHRHHHHDRNHSSIVPAWSDSLTSSQREVPVIQQPITQNDIEEAFAAERALNTSTISTLHRGWNASRSSQVPRENARSHHGQQLSIKGSYSGDSMSGLGRQTSSVTSSSCLDDQQSQQPSIDPYNNRPTQYNLSPTGGMHSRSKDPVPPTLPGPDAIRSKREVHQQPQPPQQPRESLARFFVSQHERSSSYGSQRGQLVRVSSYGELQTHQPSLMDQARMRGASSSGQHHHHHHHRVPSIPSGSRLQQQPRVMSSPGDGSRSHWRPNSPITTTTMGGVGSTGREATTAEIWLAMGSNVGGGLSLTAGVVEQQLQQQPSVHHRASNASGRDRGNNDGDNNSAANGE